MSNECTLYRFIFYGKLSKFEKTRPDHQFTGELMFMFALETSSLLYSILENSIRRRKDIPWVEVQVVDYSTGTRVRHL